MSKGGGIERALRNTVATARSSATEFVASYPSTRSPSAAWRQAMAKEARWLRESQLPSVPARRHVEGTGGRVELHSLSSVGVWAKNLARRKQEEKGEELRREIWSNVFNVYERFLKRAEGVSRSPY